MSDVNLSAIERLRKQLRQQLLTTVILRHHDCTERELYRALICERDWAGRTHQELEYFCRHNHFPGQRESQRLQSVWDVEASDERIIPRRGLRMIEDIYPRVDAAALHKMLLIVKKFRGKGVDELTFIAFHRRDPESAAELASFVAAFADRTE